MELIAKFSFVKIGDLHLIFYSNSKLVVKFNFLNKIFYLMQCKSPTVFLTLNLILVSKSNSQHDTKHMNIYLKLL